LYLRITVQRHRPATECPCHLCVRTSFNTGPTVVRCTLQHPQSARIYVRHREVDGRRHERGTQSANAKVTRLWRASASRECTQPLAVRTGGGTHFPPSHMPRTLTGTAQREMPQAALELLRQPYAHRKGVGPIHSTYKQGRWPSSGAYVLDGVKDECAAVPHASERSQWC
jgi:hypothetical protein